MRLAQRLRLDQPTDQVGHVGVRVVGVAPGSNDPAVQLGTVVGKVVAVGLPDAVVYPDAGADDVVMVTVCAHHELVDGEGVDPVSEVCHFRSFFVVDGIVQRFGVIVNSLVVVRAPRARSPRGVYI